MEACKPVIIIRMHCIYKIPAFSYIAGGYGEGEDADSGGAGTGSRDGSHTFKDCRSGGDDIVDYGNVEAVEFCRSLYSDLAFHIGSALGCRAPSLGSMGLYGYKIITDRNTTCLRYATSQLPRSGYNHVSYVCASAWAPAGGHPHRLMQTPPPSQP